MKRFSNAHSMCCFAKKIYMRGLRADLVHDFKCKEPDDMNYKELRNRANYYKKDEEGVERMSKIMQELVNEAIDEKQRDNAIEFLKLQKLTNEEIAKSLKIPVEVVDKLAEELNLMALA